VLSLRSAADERTYDGSAHFSSADERTVFTDKHTDVLGIL
jgi:hypothetical protein|tara:strand:+ start:475 stop:594 length:120 start_codon:yes stop_codon:yes gene_type:complete